MAITPADIQAQTFSEAKRGYDPAEVDVFLETLSSEVDAMLAKIVDLKGRLTATEQQLAECKDKFHGQRCFIIGYKEGVKLDVLPLQFP